MRAIDFVITLGGDGTILSAITEVRDSHVPIVGINLGRLGFLASIEKTRIREALECMCQGMYSLEKRRLLYLESNLPLFGETRFALNDFTILKRDTSSMITIHTYINGAFLNSYWADGLIVATPTGSTAYNLSAGGPILYPTLDVLMVTPICPHTLTNRPIALSLDSVIDLRLESLSEEVFLTLDGQMGFPLTTRDLVSIRRCSDPVFLITEPSRSYFQVLHRKLKWGERGG
jgi:NAD+ kinase